MWSRWVVVGLQDIRFRACNASAKGGTDQRAMSYIGRLHPRGNCLGISASASSSLPCNLFLISRSAYYGVLSVLRVLKHWSALCCPLSFHPLIAACQYEMPENCHSFRSQLLCDTLNSTLGRLVAASFAPRYLNQHISIFHYDRIPKYRHSKFPPFGPAYFWAKPGVIQVGERIQVYSCDTSWCTLATI